MKKIIKILILTVKISYNLFLIFYRAVILKYLKSPHLFIKSKISKNYFFKKIHEFLLIENFSIRNYLSEGKEIFTFQFFILRSKLFDFGKINIDQNHLLKGSSNISQEEIIFSIIIPTYKNRKKLHMCLQSIVKQKFNYFYEIIVVDDYDKSKLPPTFLGKTIKCIKNKKNLGFIGSCNLGAENARGKYLYFLNDDTLMLNADTINSLIETADQDSKIGIVGSKILLNRSSLQEAGCLTFETGECYQFGKYQNKDEDLYNFVTEPDYCSGCSLLIPRYLFNEIKFDSRYSPAYYEDVDLAFSVRSLGYKVVYQPRSSLLHFEGSSTDINSENDVKQYQYKNKKIFYQKWAYEIKNNKKEQEILSSKFRKPIVIIIDDQIPDENRDAGSFLPLFFIEYYLKKGCQIIFHSPNINPKSKDVKDLQNKGVLVIYSLSNFINYTLILKEKIKFILVFRILLLEKYFKFISKLSSKILFHYVDLHHLRMQRELNLKITNDQNEVDDIRSLETEFVKKNYLNITCSSEEEVYLREKFGVANIMFLPLLYPTKSFSNNNYKKNSSILDTLNLVFVGSFNHQPNFDAVNFFVKKIFPILSSKIKTKFYIVGPNQERVENLQNENVIVTGKIDDLGSLMSKIDIAISPLRYGAGNKGKMLTYAMYNLPTVCSPISVEGTIFENRKHCIIVNPENETDFANEILNLYLNGDLKKNISKNFTQDFIGKYTFESGFRYLDEEKRINF